MAATANGRSGSSRFQLPALDIPSSSLTDGTSIPPPPPSPPPPAVPEKTTRAAAAASSRLGALNIRNKTTTSPPQTPNAADSPNPLRSHPTSSHSLNRQLSPQADSAAAAAAAAASPANSKRVHSSSTTETPPMKRPMSVRKLLSLRALNSAFNRDSHTALSPASNKSGGDGKVYANGGNKSSDNLSLFSFRPSTSLSTSRPTPTLKKKRSSAFWGRKGSSFFGAAVPEEDVVVDQTAALEQKRTPPPTLPALDRLGAGRNLKEGDGGFLGGGDMFQNIR